MVAGDVALTPIRLMCRVAFMIWAKFGCRLSKNLDLIMFIEDVVALFVL